MRLFGVFLAVSLTACGSTGSVALDHEDADPPREAAAEDARQLADAGRDVAPDAPVEAEAGGLLCCSTNGGQNLLVCDPSTPWTCDAIGTSPSVCTDPHCTPGLQCTGFNGQGVVVVCGQ